MNVRVRLFAGAKQAFGCDSIEVELPDRATIGQLRRRLADEMPELRQVLQRAMFAVDRQYAADTNEVPPDAEIACIPPVSGG